MSKWKYRKFGKCFQEYIYTLINQVVVSEIKGKVVPSLPSDQEWHTSVLSVAYLDRYMATLDLEDYRFFTPRTTAEMV